MPNTAVDIIVIIIILLSAGLAFIRGFVRESLSLGTWSIAAYLGFTQYALVAPYLEQYVHQPQLRDFAGGLVIFGGVLLLLIPFSMYIRSFIKGEHITSIDRSFGFLFGAARGYLLISIIYLIVSWLLPEEKQPAWLKEANTKPALAYGADMVKNLIPEEQRELMEKKAKSAQENSEDAVESGQAVKEEPDKHPDLLQNILNNTKSAAPK